jgi:hypothetical protein
MCKLLADTSLHGVLFNQGSCCCAGVLTATELSWQVLAMYSALSSKLRCWTGAEWGVKQLTCTVTKRSGVM